MLFENLRIAVRSIFANKLRAALTMLGITIGVGAVITLLSVGEGVSLYIAAQFEGLGSNVVYIFPGQLKPGSGFASRQAGQAVLTERDANALLDPARVPDAAYVLPIIRHTVSVTAGSNATTVSLRATTPAFATALNYTLYSGRFFTQVEMDERAKVVVIGQTTLNHLFAPDEDPLGATIRINGFAFRIIGILNKKGASPAGDQDDTLITPYTTAVMRLFPARTTKGDISVNIILAQAVDTSRQPKLIAEITDVLREQHSIPYRGEDDFTVLSQKDVLAAFDSIINVITLFLGAVAGIALVVGGIGIMNIMLVTVTERTKEIGLRKAVGAKRYHVLTQFLVESVVLSLLGGAAGIGLGIFGAWLVHRLVPDLQTVITLNSVFLATGFSFGVGLFFGLYPAVRASGLHPIEALRYE